MQLWVISYYISKEHTILSSGLRFLDRVSQSLFIRPTAFKLTFYDVKCLTLNRTLREYLLHEFSFTSQSMGGMVFNYVENKGGKVSFSLACFPQPAVPVSQPVIFVWIVSQIVLVECCCHSEFIFVSILGLQVSR